MKLRKAFLSVAIACSVLCASGQGNPGSIAGTVVDEQGKAVGGATVFYGDDRPLAGRETFVRTDEQGHFMIQPLQLEHYSLRACKEDEDVACDIFGFTGEFQSVTLTAQLPSATVTLLLGKKAGVLDWTITDAATGKPMTAQITLRPVAYPDRPGYISGPSTFHSFIYPSMAFYLEASYVGYKTWSYSDQYNPPRPLRMAAGEHMHLDIKLIPEPQPQP